MELVLAHSSMGSKIKLRSSGLHSKCSTHGSILLVIQPRFSSWHHRGRYQHCKGSWEQRAAADHHDPMYSFLRVWQLSAGDCGGQVHSERGKSSHTDLQDSVLGSGEHRLRSYAKKKQLFLPQEDWRWHKAGDIDLRVLRLASSLQHGSLWWLKRAAAPKVTLAGRHSGFFFSFFLFYNFIYNNICVI